MDSHRNSIPLEGAELGGEGGEWLACFRNVGLPVATSEIQRGKHLVLSGEAEQGVGAWNRKLGVFENRVQLGEV